MPSTLPLPPLAQTCEKYLDSIRPIATEAELREAEEQAREFCGPSGSGRRLQSVLEERHATKRNYIEEWWDELAYFSNRGPVIPHEGVCLRDPFTRPLSREARTAVLLAYFAEFKRMIETNLPADKIGEVELCMDQYSRLFACARNPGKEVDKRQVYPDSRHVVVVCNAQFYKLDVLRAADRSPYLSSQLEPLLDFIVSDSARGALEPPVGLLTGLDRSLWAECRDRLLCFSELNAQTLHTIESALLVVVLDQQTPSSHAETLRHVFCGGLDGSRWDDKVHFVHFSNREMGIILEHSAVDGLPMVKMVSYAYDCLERQGRNTGGCQGPAPGPAQRLCWKVPSDVSRHFEQARSVRVSIFSELEADALRYEKFGRRALKAVDVHGDAFVQLGLQLTFFRLRGRVAATYESVATTKFIGGRTETNRALTSEAAAFVESMDDPRVSVPQRVQLFLAAIEKHKRGIADAADGQGIDRHLLALRVAAKQCGVVVPLFSSDVFARSTQWHLSTSQLPAPFGWAVGYQAAEHDGYGCCYNIQEDRIVVQVTTFASCALTSTKAFIAALSQAFDDLYALAKARTAKL